MQSFWINITKPITHLWTRRNIFFIQTHQFDCTNLFRQKILQRYGSVQKIKKLYNPFYYSVTTNCFSRLTSKFQHINFVDWNSNYFDQNSEWKIKEISRKNLIENPLYNHVKINEVFRSSVLYDRIFRFWVLSETRMCISVKKKLLVNAYILKLRTNTQIKTHFVTLIIRTKVSMQYWHGTHARSRMCVIIVLFIECVVNYLIKWVTCKRFARLSILSNPFFPLFSDIPDTRNSYGAKWARWKHMHHSI